MKNIAISITLFIGLALSAFAQQSVDPTVGAACTTNAFTISIFGQAGYYLCLPTAYGSALGTWQKVNPGINTQSWTINFNNAALIGTAALTKDITLMTAPAGTTVLNATLVSTVTWAGPAGLTASVGDAASTTSYTSAQNLFTTASATTFVMSSGPKMTTTAANAINVRFTATTNNLTTLTAGSLTVTLTYVLPAPSPILLASKYCPAQSSFDVISQERRQRGIPDRWQKAL